MSSSGNLPSFLPPPLIPSTSHSLGADGSLRTLQSFKVDEGYSGDETQTPSAFEEPGSSMRDRMSDVKIPAWMTGLSAELREEYAYKLVRTLPTSHIASLVNRLVPVLHLDFVQILPSELSLQILSYLPPKSLLDASLTSRTWRKFALEPRLWRDLYKAQGWEADEDEVRAFETEMQARAEREIRQQVESKRKAEENREEERKAKEARRASTMTQSTNGMSSSSQAMDISQEWGNDVIEPGGSDSLDVSYGTAMRAEDRATSFPSMMSDDEEMYPTPQHRPSAVSQSFSDPPLPIEPALTTPGYGYPRLNWAFLFKNRRRLEDNWLHNRCTPFQIPHPNYPHEGHKECIYTIQYSSKWLCSGSRDRSIRVWDVKTRRSRGEPLVGHNGSVLCLQFDESPDEDVIISGSSDASVIVWRFSTGERLHVIPRAHEESVLNLRFSKQWLVTCSKDKYIKIWNRRPLETVDPDYPWDSKLVFGPNGAPTNHPHHPRYQPTWSVQDPAATSGFNIQNPYNSSSCSNFKPQTKPPTPRTISTYTAVNLLPGHIAAVNAIQLHNDEIVSASGDRVIKLWNLKTGKCEKTFVGHHKGIACIQFDGKTIVSGSSDQTIRVFDRDTQAEIATLRGHSSLVRTVQATKNKIVSGSYDESVRVWKRDEETGGWIPGAVLRQASTPIPTNPADNTNPNHAQLQIAAFQQFQQNAMNGVIPQVQMHQVHQVGAPGFAGVVAASHLLPNPAHQHQQQIPPQIPPQQQIQQMQQMHHQAQQHANAVMQQQQQAAAVVVAAAAAPAPGSGAHRVFKLQFDARWIICCSQDTRIVGWDYAADDESIIEASRFFVSGP
ncbi:WD40 repeat-like protein [Wilcoxina mikolae CBS 423.85]|nr:WD40 repeat-like protein [Wilcoxina mikolae CBS 423.85]